MKRILSLLTALILLLPLFPAAAEDGTPVAYLYTFESGTTLEGEGSVVLRELLDAIQIRMTRQKQDRDHLYLIELISEGKTAFSLLAQDMNDGNYGLICSLLGKNQLKLRKDQITDFLRTLVQVLADLNVLKGESLEKVDGLAVRGGNLLARLVSSADADREEELNGLDLTPYLTIMTRYATEAEHRTTDPENPECPGATGVWYYKLAEQDLSAMVDSALNKLASIPVINDELKSGRLRIGGQVITDEFLRTLFGAMHGETTLEICEDGDGQILMMTLRIPELKVLMEEPELKGMITDPEFARISGLRIRIDREKGPEPENLKSDTRIEILGLDQTLVGIRLERMKGEPIRVPEIREVHEVGDMDSAELWDTLKSMWATILFHAADFVLDLPRCVFDLIIGKFKIF